ncbi:sensor histidine kinase [Flexivirga caeni]|uniref:Sensor histidine kinase n=1 Tax=Flexivirga caeni TaxID=2294115 RepID=A0A3M9MA03_9MICO|nr:sensor histidine kinase [Flexivirga caeni]RNI21378.1 sensor histidine kinase [Flexivirga caeni]
MRMVDRLQFLNGLIAIAIFAVAPLFLGGLPDLPDPLRVVYWVCIALVGGLFTLIAGTPIAFPRNPRTWTIAGALVVGCYVAAALGSIYGFGIMLLAFATAFWANFVPIRVSILTIVLLLPLNTALAFAVAHGATSNLVLNASLTLLVECFALVTTTQVAAAERARQDAERANHALREAQAQLRTQSATEERLRIARELHDVVGHRLAGLTLTLETARHLPPEQGAPYLENAQRAGKELLGQVRNVVSELREGPATPASLGELGHTWPGLDVHLTDLDLAERLPEDVRHATVRLAQEALTNAARHGAATRAWVTLEDCDGSFSVVVRDNGVGTTTAVEGNGLRGMRERFEALGGSVVWHGMPNGGFVVQASAPLEAPSAVGGAMVQEHV